MNIQDGDGMNDALFGGGGIGLATDHPILEEDSTVGCLEGEKKNADADRRMESKG